MKKVISVEISPNCSFRCNHCNVQKRLHLDKTRDEPSIVEKIVKYVPKGSRLLFVGLGEPLMPLGQKRIYEIMLKRPDIEAFVQTNGSFEIDKKLVSFVKKKRLDIGLSYDDHHKNLTNDKIKIQKELVSGISISLGSIPPEFSVSRIKKYFPNLNRILVEPLLNGSGEKPFISWKKIFNFCKCVCNQDRSVIVYMEISTHWKLKELEYIVKTAKKNKEVLRNWFKIPAGFYVFLDDHTKSIRILIDSSVLLDGSKAILSWKEIEKDIVPMEEAFEGKK